MARLNTSSHPSLYSSLFHIRVLYSIVSDSIYHCKVKEKRATMEICHDLEERGLEKRCVENRFEEIREGEEGEERGETREELECRAGNAWRKKRRQEYKYSCLRCLKSYKRKGHLVEHQKIFCGKDKQQCCPYCVFRTYKKSNLKKHVNRRHCNVIDYTQSLE